MKYKDFDAWFWEIENYATRGERFFEELKHMDDRRGLEWLKAAWECATALRDEESPHVTWMDRGCFERGCCTHDDRDGDGVLVQMTKADRK